MQEDLSELDYMVMACGTIQVGFSVTLTHPRIIPMLYRLLVGVRIVMTVNHIGSLGILGVNIGVSHLLVIEVCSQHFDMVQRIYDET